MGPVAQFVLALMVASTTLAGGSLLWPRFTTMERPRLLEDVHDMVIRTPIGVQTASVLGVSDEASIEPFSLGGIVGSAAGSVKGAIARRTQTIVVTNAVRELTRQFDKLPKEQQDYIQEALCKPKEDQ